MANSLLTTLVDFQDIAEVTMITCADEVNRNLVLGWMLMGLSSNQYSEHGYTLTYHLGWRKSLGEPKRADSNMDAWLKERSSGIESAPAEQGDGDTH